MRRSSGISHVAVQVGTNSCSLTLTPVRRCATTAGILTRDLGGSASTNDVTKALIDALGARQP